MPHIELNPDIHVRIFSVISLKATPEEIRLLN